MGSRGSAGGGAGGGGGGGAVGVEAGVTGEPLFPLGPIFNSRAVQFALEDGDLTRPELRGYLNRHQTGDFGEMDPQDLAANRRAIAEGSRVFSSYNLGRDVPGDFGAPQDRLWIITEADRSATTFIFPNEY